MQVTLPVCPIHFNGGAGHDNNFPPFILIPLVKCVMKIVDKGESNGRKGCVEM